MRQTNVPGLKSGEARSPFPYGEGSSPLQCGDGFRFPRKEKLKGKDEIREVFKRKRYFSCPGVKLFMLANGLSYNRIAFAFPRKFGNAVERNRSRRLSREAYRQLRNKLQKGYDLVLLIYPEKNPGPRRDTFSIRLNQLSELFLQAGLWNS